MKTTADELHLSDRVKRSKFINIVRSGIGLDGEEIKITPPRGRSVKGVLLGCITSIVGQPIDSPAVLYRNQPNQRFLVIDSNQPDQKQYDRRKIKLIEPTGAEIELVSSNTPEINVGLKTRQRWAELDGNV